MATKKEAAITRARLFPSTYARLRLRGAKSLPSKTIAEVVDELEKSATRYDKIIKKSGE